MIERLWLNDFRSYVEADLSFSPGLTAIVGRNGRGKSNLLEAIAFLGRLESFRGSPVDALIRSGAPAAVVRGEVRSGGRPVLIESEIPASGRTRTQVNRQRLVRRADLYEAFRVSVFSPDDLDLVKDGPAVRRRYLDETLVMVQPRHDALRTELDRVLRQRNALLKQMHGRLSAETEVTLDVWDQRLVVVADDLGRRRAEIVERLQPVVAQAYAEVAAAEVPVRLAYEAPWLAGGLGAALVASRRDDVRRGLSLVGPHRDDLSVSLNGLPARTHASQGEQRSLALALRLAAHRLVTDETGVAPVLLLDDVFSELDAERGAALLRSLPEGQTVLTTAGDLPPGSVADAVVRIDGGGGVASTVVGTVAGAVIDGAGSEQAAG